MGIWEKVTAEDHCIVIQLFKVSGFVCCMFFPDSVGEEHSACEAGDFAERAVTKYKHPVT